MHKWRHIGIAPDSYLAVLGMNLPSLRRKSIFKVGFDL